MTQTNNLFSNLTFSRDYQDWIYFTASLIIGLIIGVSPLILSLLLTQPLIVIFICIYGIFFSIFLACFLGFLKALLHFNAEEICKKLFGTIFFSPILIPFVFLAIESPNLIDALNLEHSLNNPDNYYSIVLLLSFFMLYILVSIKNAWILLLKDFFWVALTNKTNRHITKAQRQEKKSFLSLFFVQFKKFLIMAFCGIPIVILFIIFNWLTPHLMDTVANILFKFGVLLIFILFLLPLHHKENNPKEAKTSLLKQKTSKKGEKKTKENFFKKNGGKLKKTTSKKRKHCPYRVVE
ncbi:MAG: hypothetical protein IKZ02_01315 [Alphaproteobacteria bacterium]|nr:hypothetical protein [Alphaproteobacteria bacterium]